MELVKTALLEAYKKRIFCGGRGLPREPSCETHYINGMYYCNAVDRRDNDFSRFSGREAVVQKSSCDMLYYHNYSGKLLISLK